ncbi:MAG: IclR family transcriptional regulator [Actinobacteria bacterium]|nr:IclR family transcriptional regulator [Actinomycetota bacterium]
MPAGLIRAANDGSPVRSVSRALDILFAMEHGPRTVGAIARATGLSTVTARRLLATLAYRDLAVQDRTAPTYRLGSGCFGILDAVARGGGGLEVIAGPVLMRLARETGETVALYVRAGPRRICVAQIPSVHPIRYAARMGMENPIHTGAMGKVLLAFSDPAERDDILDHMDLIAYTPETIIDRAVLERELEHVRRQGYAESRGERSPGVAAVGAPVFGADGRVIAALCVIGPVERLDDTVLAKLRQPVMAAAKDVAERLARTPARRKARE